MVSYGGMMNKYEVCETAWGTHDKLMNNLTGEYYFLDKDVAHDICKLLNSECERSDRMIESFTTEELLKLKWKSSIHERYNNEVNHILDKYDIGSLKKLDRILFENKVM